MRILADFLVVIGAMLLTGTLCIIGIFSGQGTRENAPLLFYIVMFAMLGAAMLATGILVHLRK